MDSDFPELSQISPEQAIGLLSACGNYVLRRLDVPFGELPDPANPGTAEQQGAHRVLMEAYFRIGTSPAVPTSQVRKPVFTPEQQQKLAVHKYIRGRQKITHAQLTDLVRAVREYAAVAAPLDLLRIDGSSLAALQINRYRHAHNWIIRFATQPFTDQHFVDDLHDRVLSQKSVFARK